MSNGSSRHSVSPGRPADPSLAGVLDAINEIISALNCLFFVAGATARDLVLVNVFGLRPGRATRDIHLGIAVESWDQFRAVKDRLIAAGNFNKDAADLHRLLTTLHRRRNFDRLYEEETDLLEANAYDLELSSAQLLGEDTARVCNPTTLEQIRSILTIERHRERLIAQMAQTSAHDDAWEATKRVDGFCQGFVR